MKQKGGFGMKVIVMKPSNMMSGLLRLVFGIHKESAQDS